MSRPRISSTTRAGGRRAGPEIEAAFVTGREEAVLLRARDHRAGQVRARLLKRDELGRAQAHEQTRLVLVGVGEPDRAADGDDVERDDVLDRRRAAALAIPVLRRNPDLPDGERG